VARASAKVDARPVLRSVERASTRRVCVTLCPCHALIAVSRATADRILGRCANSAQRVRVIHNGAGKAFVAPANWRPRGRAQRSSSASEAPISWVAAERAVQAHQLCCRPFAPSSAGRALGARATHASRGGLERLARELASRSSRLVADLVRGQSWSRVQRRARGAALAVEGFRYSSAEAMAAVAVIASDTPALVEVLGGAGCTPPVGDAAGIARAMHRTATPRCTMSCASVGWNERAPSVGTLPATRRWRCTATPRMPAPTAGRRARA